jgi:hypothetical protein
MIGWTQWIGANGYTNGLTQAWAAEQAAEFQAGANVIQQWANTQGTNTASYDAAVSQATATYTAAQVSADDLEISKQAAALQSWNTTISENASLWQSSLAQDTATLVGSNDTSSGNTAQAMLQATVPLQESLTNALSTFQEDVILAECTLVENQVTNLDAEVTTDSAALDSWATTVQEVSNTQDQSAVTSLQTWTNTVTYSGQVDADTVASAIQSWLKASDALWQPTLDSLQTADTTFLSNNWSSWHTLLQGMVTDDITQVVAVGQAALAAVSPLNNAESTFAASLATAYGVAAGSQTQAEWTYRLAQVQINQASALAATNLNLANMQAAPASSFASVYPVNNGPGTNTGVNNNNNDIFTTIAANLDFWTGGSSQQVLTSPAFGAALNATDQFFAGMADSLTAGLSTRARTAIYGQTASQNHQGEYFQAGQTTGTLLNLAIGCGNPCSMSSVGATGYRTLNGIQAIGGTLNATENFANGKPLQAGVELLNVAGNLASFKLHCFIAGTPIRTPSGSVPIEEIQAGDLVLSRSEKDTEGAIQAKVVEEIFIRSGLVFKLGLGGQEIGTTAEHPFYVYNRGWVAAGELHVGDLLCCEDGNWRTVEDVRDTGKIQTLYNMRVVDHHTYFVGSPEWRFSVWAHNADYPQPVGVADGHSYPQGASDYAARKAYRTAVGEAENSVHGYKHLQASTEAEAMQFSRGGGAAQYLPEVSNVGLEKIALQKGFVIQHGGAYHSYVQFDKPIGYDNGRATNWIRAELSGQAYHGHPISESRLPKVVREFFGL